MTTYYADDGWLEKRCTGCGKPAAEGEEKRRPLPRAKPLGRPSRRRGDLCREQNRWDAPAVLGPRRPTVGNRGGTT
jgi:hypothetical protein